MMDIPWKDDSELKGTTRAVRAVIDDIELMAIEIAATPLSERFFCWAIYRLPNYICLRTDVATSFETAKKKAEETYARIKAAD